MIDRYLLRYFLAVVDCGNFSRAAAHCNVTQPTLSVGIAKLERELGAPLFHRSNQRIGLTTAGTKFLVHARRIEAEFNSALQAMRLSEDPPLLRLGILTSIPGELIARAVRAEACALSSAPLEILFGNERELIANLTRGRIDMALTLVHRGSERFLEMPLISERYGLALPSGHPRAGQERVAAENLASDVMIVRRHCEMLSETSRYFTDRGVRPRFSLRSTNDERVLQMVAAGLGITVMPMSYQHAGVERAALLGFEIERVLGFAFGHNAEQLSTNMPVLAAAIAAELRALQ